MRIVRLSTVVLILESLVDSTSFNVRFQNYRGSETYFHSDFQSWAHWRLTFSILFMQRNDGPTENHHLGAEILGGRCRLSARDQFGGVAWCNKKHCSWNEGFWSVAIHMNKVCYFYTVVVYTFAHVYIMHTYLYIYISYMHIYIVFLALFCILHVNYYMNICSSWDHAIHVLTIHIMFNDRWLWYVPQLRKDCKAGHDSFASQRWQVHFLGGPWDPDDVSQMYFSKIISQLCDHIVNRKKTFTLHIVSYLATGTSPALAC